MPLSNAAKIGISWSILTVFGVYAFYLSKENVIAKRVEHMKIRERMYSSNQGDYEPSSRKFV